MGGANARRRTVNPPPKKGPLQPHHHAVQTRERGRAGASQNSDSVAARRLIAGAQFLYGEDGIDPLKQLGLKWLDHLADNSKAITGQPMLSKALAAMDRKSAKKHVKQVSLAQSR